MTSGKTKEDAARIDAIIDRNLKLVACGQEHLLRCKAEPRQHLEVNWHRQKEHQWFGCRLVLWKWLKDRRRWLLGRFDFIALLPDSTRV